MASKKRLIGLVLPCIGLSWAVNASAHTLPEAVEAAFATSPDLFIETTTRRMTDHELREAYGGFLPRVDLNLGYGREYSKNPTTEALPDRDDITLTRREASLTLTQLLYDGYGTASNVCSNQHRVYAASHRVHDAAEDLALRVAEVFLDVRKRSKLVEINKANLAAHQRIYNQIRERSESGIGRKADLDQAQSRLSLARTNLIAEQANLRDAKTNYMRVVGLPGIGLSAVASPDSAIPETEEAAVSMAIANHPTLKSSMSDVDATRSRYEFERSAFHPRVDLELGASRNKNLDGSEGINNDAYAMVRLRYNLFRGGSDLARTRARAWEVQNAAEVRNRARRQIEESMRLDWNTYVTARAQNSHFKRRVEATQQTRDAYHKQFDIGQRTLLDLLDSENELFTAKNSYIDSQFTELFGKLRVLHSMGALVSYLGLNLPEETIIEPTGMFDSVDRLPPDPRI